MSYPIRSPIETVSTGPDGLPRWKARPPVSIESLSPTKPKPGMPNPARPGVAGQGQKPEDKDSQEYKKKQLLAKGPVYNMDYDNATTYEMSESLFTSLKDLFEAMVASQVRMGVISPQKLIEVLKRDNEMFRGNIHQDAHEFLNMLLNQVVDTVEENTKKMQALQKTGESTKNASLEHAFKNIAVHANAGKSTEDIRWVHELFQGTLTSETKCLTCENISQRDEPFLDLSVDLEAHSSVTSCLRKFSQEEMLRERDKFFCDNCGGLQEAEKRMKVKRLPKILALHLKRFRYTEDLQRLQKLFHRIVYPYHLRLFNTTDDAEDPDRLYELYAVVVHIGIGPYHGHYVSIIKTHDRGWLLFDDELVEPVDKAFVLNFFGDRANLACAYVLFYRETTLEAVKQELEAEGKASNARYAAAAIPHKETSHGFGLGLTLKTNGITPSHAPATSVDEESSSAPLTSLDHAITAPPTALSPSHTSAQPSAFTTPLIQAQTTQPTPDLAFSPQSPKAATPLSKKERAKEEKERKAEEKERKAAEKEAAKQAKVARKEEEARQRQAMKNQAAEIRAAIDKKSSSSSSDQNHAKAEIQSPQKDVPIVAPTNGTSTAAPSVATTTAASTATPATAASILATEIPVTASPSPMNGHTHSSSIGGGAFNRFRQSSKSLKAKPKFWGGSGSSSNTPASKDDSAVIDSEEKDVGEEAKPTDKPEGRENQKKTSRFSLRRKGSIMWGS